MSLLIRDHGGGDFAPLPIGVHVAVCNLVADVGADGKTYANIMSLMALPRGAARPSAERPLTKYSPDDPGQFEQLQPWLQDRIEQAQQAEAPRETMSSPTGDTTSYDDFSDDIPF